MEDLRTSLFQDIQQSRPPKSPKVVTSLVEPTPNSPFDADPIDNSVYPQPLLLP
jgi:hypothetical protein